MKIHLTCQWQARQWRCEIVQQHKVVDSVEIYTGNSYKKNYEILFSKTLTKMHLSREVMMVPVFERSHTINQLPLPRCFPLLSISPLSQVSLNSKTNCHSYQSNSTYQSKSFPTVIQTRSTPLTDTIKKRTTQKKVKLIDSKVTNTKYWFMCECFHARIYTCKQRHWSRFFF